MRRNSVVRLWFVVTHVHDVVAKYAAANDGASIDSLSSSIKATGLVSSEVDVSVLSLLQVKTDLALGQPQGAQAKLSGTSEETDPAVQKDEDFQKDYVIDGNPSSYDSWLYVDWAAILDFFNIFNNFNIKAFFDSVKVKAVFAEYLAMTFFVIIGCGTAMGVVKSPSWILQVSLTFGFAISVLGYAVGHYSGAHINCAVTFALCLAGQVGWFQGFCFLVAQLLGSITGATVLACMYPESKDLTGSLGSNELNEGYKVAHALAGEVLMTFLLIFVVLETTVSPETAASRMMACLAIGFAVFLAHVVLIPVDGCSINPTRSFGPAVIAKCTRSKDLHTFRDMWIFWLGPLWGAAAAVGVFSILE